MSELDLLIRGGLVALPEKMENVDIGIHEGRIVALGPNLDFRAGAVLEASGLLVMPGAVDTAVHFSETGNGSLATGSAALAAGGGTLFLDLPGDSSQPVFNRDDFLRKKERALATSRLDFALWAGISSRNLYEMDSLRDCGAVGFHASLGLTAASDLPPVNAAVLGRAMRRAAKLKLPVLVHTEVDGSILELRRALLFDGLRNHEAYAVSRPIEAELDAIHIALELAGETGCSLHLSPVTTPEAVDLVFTGRSRGVDVTIGTAAHYLLFDENDASRLGCLARPAPPLRSQTVRNGLLAEMATGGIDLIGSGHRGGGMSEEDMDDNALLPEGIAGCQHAFLFLWTGAALEPESGPRLAQLTRMFTGQAAARFGLARRKGSIAMGRDADLTLLDLEETDWVAPSSLLAGRRAGAYANRSAPGRIVRTLQRGQTVFANGQVAKRREVCFIRPSA